MIPINAIDIEMTIRLILAFVLSAVPGFEREVSEHPAGIRTHMLVAAGSACFTMVGIFAVDPGKYDWARVAAQVVSGIGFLGAGAILRDGRSIRGLTTAASVWMAAAIGMMAGAGLYFLAITATILTFLVLRYARIFDRGKRPRSTPAEED